MPKNLYIAVDFDGTIVHHRFPEIGPEVPNAMSVLRVLQSDPSIKLLLWTVRSDNADRKYLQEAVDWCRDRGVTFYGVNQNPDQLSWSSSPKMYAHIYIDDAALGCPLGGPLFEGTRQPADWTKIMEQLVPSIHPRQEPVIPQT